MTEDNRGIGADPYPSGIYSVLSYPEADAAPPATRPAAGPRPAVAPAPPAARPAQSAGETAPPGTVLTRLGDIEATATTLRTPAGDVPLAHAVVTVVDDLEVRTPTWAVLCAIVGFLVVPVVSLLFLLVRETVRTEALRVVVSGGGVRYETLVTDPDEQDVARSLAASS